MSKENCSARLTRVLICLRFLWSVYIMGAEPPLTSIDVLTSIHVYSIDVLGMGSLDRGIYQDVINVGDDKFTKNVLQNVIDECY